MATFLDNTSVDNMLSNQGRTGPLSARGPRSAGGKRRKQKGGPSGQLSAQDLIQLFSAMPVPNRGYKNPNASQPAKMGQGMEWFDKNNSPEQVAGRQARTDASRQSLLDQGASNGASAVDFMKQTKGFTDASGAFVPPTMPMTPTSAYGSGSVSFLPPGQKARGTMTDPLTGKKVFMDEYLPQQSLVQDSKYGAMPGQENGGALAPRLSPQGPVPQPKTASSTQADMAALFPGAGSPNLPATFPPGLPMDTPGNASAVSRLASPYLPDTQASTAPAQKSLQADITGFAQNLPPLTQNGLVPDLWNSGNSFLAGLGDLYANNVGRPLDKLLFGIQPPAQPSSNMQDYQKSKGIKQGWW